MANDKYDGITIGTLATEKYLEETGIMAAPGIGFGDAGEGSVRFAFTRGDDVIAEAVKRMEAM